jgi:dolichol-phosphate mannosyltransferase
VVDNGSRDDTILSAKEAAEKISLPVTIIKNNQNYSLGGSIKSAFLYAINNNFDYMITLHGDDQGDIRDIAGPIKAGRHHGQDMLIGARFHPQSKLSGYSRFRIFGNLVLNMMCAVITWRKNYDMTAGLNCYSVDFLRSKFFLPFPNDLTFDSHVLLYAIYKKKAWSYFPMTWREDDQISNAKVFRQAWTVFKLFVTYVTTDKDGLFAINKSGFDAGFTYPGTVVFER